MANRTMLRRQIENFAAIRQSKNVVIRDRNGNEVDIDHVLFMCPLCTKLWSESVAANAVTEEHVPPKRLGGKPECVTCRSCNSDHGSKIDSRLIQSLNYEATMSGKHPTISYRAKVKTQSGKTANVNFSQGEEPHWRLFYNPKPENLDHHEKIGREILTPNSKFNVEFRFPTEQAKKMGLLRIAYLKAFCTLGYSYLFHIGSEAIDLIVKQLKKPKETLFPIHFAYGMDNLPDETIGVNIVYDPFPLRSLFIVFDLDYQGYSERYGVFLPGLRPDWQATFSVLGAKSENFLFKITPCNPDNLDYQEHPWLAQEMWDRVFPEG